MPQPNANQSSGYPLSALFLLTAVCAVVAAAASLLARTLTSESAGGGDVLAAALGGAFWMMGLGVFVGLFHHRRRRGAGLGAVAGIILGLGVGPLALLPAEAFGSLVGTSLGGALLLIVLAFGLRLRGI